MLSMNYFVHFIITKLCKSAPKVVLLYTCCCYYLFLSLSFNSVTGQQDQLAFLFTGPLSINTCFLNWMFFITDT